MSRVLRSRASESLLEALLDYAREVLDADIAVFSERIPGEPLRGVFRGGAVVGRGRGGGRSASD